MRHMYARLGLLSKYLEPLGRRAQGNLAGVWGALALLFLQAAHLHPFSASSSPEHAPGSFSTLRAAPRPPRLNLNQPPSGSACIPSEPCRLPLVAQATGRHRTSTPGSPFCPTF